MLKLYFFHLQCSTCLLQRQTLGTSHTWAQPVRDWPCTSSGTRAWCQSTWRPELYTAPTSQIYPRLWQHCINISSPYVLHYFLIQMSCFVYKCRDKSKCGLTFFQKTSVCQGLHLSLTHAKPRSKAHMRKKRNVMMHVIVNVIFSKQILLEGHHLEHNRCHSG